MKPLRVNEMQPSVAWAWPPDVLVLSHDLTTQLNTIKRYPAKLRVLFFYFLYNNNNNNIYTMQLDL